MIDRKQVQKTARLLHAGLGSIVKFLEGDPAEIVRGVGEKLHLVKPRRSYRGLGVALGLLGAAAVAGFLLKSGRETTESY